MLNVVKTFVGEEDGAGEDDGAEMATKFEIQKPTLATVHMNDPLKQRYLATTESSLTGDWQTSPSQVTKISGGLIRLHISRCAIFTPVDWDWVRGRFYFRSDCASSGACTVSDEQNSNRLFTLCVPSPA